MVLLLVTMSKKQNKFSNTLDHALHNEKVCKYLNKKTEYGDWVITTAFYASQHFLSSKIFPLERKKQTYNSFDDYCAVNRRNKGKHAMFSELIEDLVPDVAPLYNHLKNISWTARYVNYEYGREISSLAVQHLGKIKKICLPKI